MTSAFYRLFTAPGIADCSNLSQSSMLAVPKLIRVDISSSTVPPIPIKDLAMFYAYAGSNFLAKSFMPIAAIFIDFGAAIVISGPPKAFDFSA